MALTWPPDAATLLLLWPILTAVISCFYNYLDGIPRVHAVLSLLVKAGVDLPGILDALHRAITGLTPAQKEAQKPAVRAAVKALGAVAVLMILGALLVGCPKPSNAPGSSMLSQFEQAVLTQLESKATLATIEAAVAQYVPDGVVVDVAINDAIAFLHDLNVIPPDVLPTAVAVSHQLSAKLGAAAHASPPLP